MTTYNSNEKSTGEKIAIAAIVITIIFFVFFILRYLFTLGTRNKANALKEKFLYSGASALDTEEIVFLSNNLKYINKHERQLVINKLETVAYVS
jgi:hypothetical protein